MNGHSGIGANACQRMQTLRATVLKSAQSGFESQWGHRYRCSSGQFSCGLACGVGPLTAARVSVASAVSEMRQDVSCSLLSVADAKITGDRANELGLFPG